MSATHIVKLWEEEDSRSWRQTSSFAFRSRQRLGMAVPKFALSDDGGALVDRPFRPDGGRYLGFEDFCVLNALGTADKYKGGYETRVFRRLREFVAPAEAARSLEDLFRLFLLNCAIRNGDAHLKNFGIIYEHVDGPAKLAPAL